MSLRLRRVLCALCNSSGAQRFTESWASVLCLETRDDPVLEAEACWVATRHESCPGGGAEWLGVVVIDFDAFVQERIHIRPCEVLEVTRAIREIVEAQVVNQHEEEVGLLLP